MQPRIEGVNCKVSESTRDYIEKHTEKLIQLLDRITACEVILTEDRRGHSVEFIVKVPHQTLVASAQVEGDNLYKAIDAAYRRLEVQLKRHQGKLVTRRRPTRRQNGAEVDLAQEEQDLQAVEEA